VEGIRFVALLDFGATAEGLGRPDVIEHVIDVGNAVPIIKRKWPVTEESRSPRSSN